MTTEKDPSGARRQTGSLEQDVLSVLRAADGGLTPGEVRRTLDSDLAYTTVMTTLSRLHGKGQVERVRSGRAYSYSPVERADDVAARSMSDLLARGSDRAAVLTRFVERLGPDEEAVLRRLLESAQDG